MSKYQMIIGRGEPLSFPELNIADVPAKTDTGAYRSAVHCTNAKLVKNKEGIEVLRYTLFSNHPCAQETEVQETTDFKQVTIANSFGHEEKRYEVKLRVKIGTKLFLTSFTLADRSKKIYPILMGRKMIRNKFLVDVSITNINRTLLRERYGVNFPEDEESKDD